MNAKKSNLISAIFFTIVTIVEMFSFRYVLLNMSITNLQLGVILLLLAIAFPCAMALVMIGRDTPLSDKAKKTVVLGTLLYVIFMLCNWENEIIVTQVCLSMFSSVFASMDLQGIVPCTVIIVLKTVLLIAAAFFAMNAGDKVKAAPVDEVQNAVEAEQADAPAESSEEPQTEDAPEKESESV